MSRRNTNDIECLNIAGIQYTLKKMPGEFGLAGRKEWIEQRCINYLKEHGNIQAENVCDYVRLSRFWYNVTVYKCTYHPSIMERLKK